MRFGYHGRYLDHDPGHRHPETPDRLRAIRSELEGHHGVEYVEPDPVEADLVERVHDPEYVDRFRTFCADGGGRWDPDTVAVKATFEVALAAAGGAVWAAETAMDGVDGRDTPFSLGRPPGHHAVANDAMGFCFFNNVAVAAEAALDRGADRVAVVDWDVHHGNGTNDLFLDRGDVFFSSIHERGLYPGSGVAAETGVGDGNDATLNVPLSPGAGDAEYLAVVEDLLVPLLARFDPDCLLVSAGFDAHRHDPISRMRLSTDTYGVLTERLRDVATDTDAGLAFVLEGGYALDVLAESVATVHETFAGYRPVVPEGDPNEDVANLIQSQRERFELD